MVRHEHFAMTGHARLEVHVPAGEVSVRVGGERTIDVTIDAANADDAEVVHIGSTVSVDVRRRRRGRSVRVVVEVPAGSDVAISTAAARIQLEGRLGAARLRTASGDIDVATVARLDLSTASGSVSVEAVAGDVGCTSVSGGASFGTVGGRWAASSASGALRSRAVAGDVEVVTTSGNVRIDRCDGDDISVRSVSGDIRVGLPTGIKVDADIATLSGRTRLPEPAAPSAATDRRDVRLRLRTVSGDVLVDRAT